MPPSHKCTPEVTEQVATILAEGDYLTVACALTGISDAVAYKWLDRGTTEIERRQSGLTAAQRREHGLPPRAQEEPFVRFVEAVTRARAEAEQKHRRNVERIAMGGQVVEEREEVAPDGTRVTTKKIALGDWRASAFYLERVHPKRWGRRQAVEVSGPDGGPMQVDSSEGARLAARLEDFLRRAREDPARVIEGEVVHRAITDGSEHADNAGAEPESGPRGEPDGAGVPRDSGGDRGADHAEGGTEDR